MGWETSYEPLVILNRDTSPVDGAVDFPEPSPAASWGGFGSVQAVMIEKRLIGANESIENWNPFSLKSMLNNQVVVGGKDFDWMLSRDSCYPAAES
jgi:hypothetical protein